MFWQSCYSRSHICRRFQFFSLCAVVCDKHPKLVGSGGDDAILCPHTPTKYSPLQVCYAASIFYLPSTLATASSIKRDAVSGKGQQHGEQLQLFFS